MMSLYLTDRRKREILVDELKQNRVTYEPTWLDIGQYDLPERLRLRLTDQGRGDRRNTNIYDSTVAECIETFESGLMTAATDPSSRWMNQTIKGDPDRAEFGPVKSYLDGRTQIILEQVDDSNMYTSLPTGYGNEATFGLFAMSIEESYRRGAIHTRIFPTGSFWIGQDDEATVHTFYTEHRMSVRSLYMRFGELGQFSRHVQDLIDKSSWEEYVDVGRLIQPNDDADARSPLARSMPFSTCWYELGNSSKDNSYSTGNGSEDSYLEEGGFREFPIMVGRWGITEGDIYPNEYPGLRSLGDTKSLQIGEKRSWQGIEKLINPHWLAPEALRGTLDHGMLPGGTSYVSVQDEGKSIRPAHVMDPAYIGPLEEKQDRVRSRIREAFHYPTFSTFDSIPDKANRTATEIIERKAEKLLKLVKMYTNLQKGVLRPGVARIDAICERQGLFDGMSIPADLDGHTKDYKFNGVLAQAQRMNRVQPNQAILRQVSEMAANNPQDPGMWDKLDRDQAIDVIATDMGCDPSLIRSDEQTAQIRADRAKQQAAAQKMQAIEQASMAAKNLGQASTADGTALGALVKR